MSDDAEKFENPYDKPGAYQPTKGEMDLAQKMIQRRKSETQKPRYKVTHPDGKVTISPDHPDYACNHVKLAELFCTGDSTLAEGLMIQLANAAQWGDELSTDDLNVMISTVAAIAPRDTTEALLACQMAAIHKATMTAVRRLSRAQVVEQQDSASNMANKLARTYTTQMEALKRYRSTGEQKIRVQYVTVNEGGQAIVGDVTGGGGIPKNASQSHALDEAAAAGGADARRPALPCNQQAVWSPMPSAGSEGLQCVPNARRAGGGADGETERRMAARARDE